MRGRTVAWALAGITAAALLVRLWQLPRYGLWTDEVYTLHVASRPLMEALAERDQTPPLFALLLHLWMEVFGSGDVAVRMLPVLFGTAAVPLVHQVARRFGPQRFALVAAGLAAVMVYFVVLSQEARSYALLLLLSVASFLAYLRLEEKPTRGRAAAYVAVGALLLYSHLYGAFYLLAQNLDLLTRDPRRWASPRWLGLQAAIAALFLPWTPVLLEASHRVANGFWIQPPTLTDLFWTRFVLTGSRVLSYVVPFLALWAAWQGWRKQPTPLAGRPAVLWWWLAVPVVVPFVVSFWYPIFTPRYCVPATVPLMLLALRALETGLATRPRVRCAAVAGLVVLHVVAAAVALTLPSQMLDGRQDWPGVVALVEDRAQPGAVLLFNKGYCDSASDRDLACAYERYQHRHDVSLVPFFFEDRGVSKPVTNETVGEVDPLVAGASDVWVLSSYPSDLEGLIPARLAALGFHPAGSWEFKRIDVLRFER